MELLQNIAYEWVGRRPSMQVVLEVRWWVSRIFKYFPPLKLTRSTSKLKIFHFYQLRRATDITSKPTLKVALVVLV
jgi:hypothetical protein